MNLPVNACEILVLKNSVMLCVHFIISVTLGTHLINRTSVLYNTSIPIVMHFHYTIQGFFFSNTAKKDNSWFAYNGQQSPPPSPNFSFISEFSLTSWRKYVTLCSLFCVFIRCKRKFHKKLTFVHNLPYGLSHIFNIKKFFFDISFMM